MKKTAALIIVLMLLFSTVSCARGGNYPSETTPSAAGTLMTGPDETDGATPYELVPKEKFGGHTFKIYYPDFDSCYTDFLATELTGDILNDEVFERNRRVENDLDINIEINWAARADVFARVRTQYTAGDQDFDLFGGHRDAMNLSYGGMLYDFRKMDEVRLDEKWWDRGFTQAMEINGSVYTAFSDASVDCMLFVSSLTFNKKLFDDLNLTEPYSEVRDGSWTYDKLLSITADYGTDLNSDGKMKLDDDLFSITGWYAESTYSSFYTSGFTFLNRDAGGRYVLEYDAETAGDIFGKSLELWTAPGAYVDFTGGNEAHQKLYSVFPSGRSLFCDICLNKIGWFFKDMTDNYGIIPTPKLNEDQERYFSYGGFTIPFFLVTGNTENPHRTGVILECLATASYDSLSPAMLEIVTKTRNVRDAESGEMVELIIRNKIYPAENFFNLTGLGTIPSTVVKNRVFMPSILKGYNSGANKEWGRIQAEFDALQ
ncbi:MAG: hypothetical protein IJU46_05540 [Clostridia bacterium]|nr:hypothetical protein [Clostridia bacterium]